MAASKTTAKSKTTRGKAQDKKKPATKPASKPAAKTTKPKAAAPKSAPAKGRGKQKPAPEKKEYPTSIAEKKAWSSGKKVNKKTGFTEGTISDKIAMALLKGGESRVKIVNSIPDLPTETKKGTTFQAANVAATVERQMVAMGFKVVQSYKLVPPK